MLWTLPTLTPEMRTSDCSASCVASLKGILTSYVLARNGVEPPKVTQRKSRIPKQDRAKPVMTRSCVVLGARLLIRFPSALRRFQIWWGTGREFQFGGGCSAFRAGFGGRA